MVLEHCVALRFVTLGLEKDPLEKNRSCFVYKLNLHTHYLVNSFLSHFFSTSLHSNSKMKNFSFDTSKDFKIHLLWNLSS
jgi:hypothetical protein